MDTSEARTLLGRHLTIYRARSYSDLVASIGTQEVIETEGAGGVRYTIEVEAFWDSRPGGAVHVLGAIDDGGIRSFRPLCEDFIKAPDGTFVGE